MRCKRCNGLMIVESSIVDDFEEKLAGRGVLRCVNCGAMVTVRMLRNLAVQQAEGIKTPEATGVYARHAKRTMRVMGALWKQ